MVCRYCKQERPLSQFAKYKKLACGYDTICKECQKWRMKLTNYGITKEQYDAMLAEQNNACAICGCGPDSNRCTHGHLAVDHCHTHGNVRALLCDHCNQALGRMNDQPALLVAAAAYLEKFQEAA